MVEAIGIDEVTHGEEENTVLGGRPAEYYCYRESRGRGPLQDPEKEQQEGSSALLTALAEKAQQENGELSHHIKYHRGH